MDDLTFLSTEVENDSENTEEDVDLIVSAALTRTERRCAEYKKIQILHSCEDAGGSETVEICEKTVNPNIRVNSENFKIQRVIGKGGYGKVFLVQKVDGVDKDKLYAMKVLKKAKLICNEKDKAHTVSERNILQMLRHPFLVKLHYAFQNHSNLYIVLEYCAGGELFNHLEREGVLLENAACFYTSEIVLAIGHLHSLGIIYRDLKSENVLLDRQGHVKLTDFGLSKEGVCTTNTFCGTIEYMAPEIIRCEGHGKAVDWWSLGTLLFDMLSGGPPFSQEESREATTHKILTAPIMFPPAFSMEVTSLLRGLLKRDPKERLGSKEDVEEIKRHKFFRRHEISWPDVFHRRLRPPFRPKLAADNDVSMFDPTFTRLQPIVSPSDCAPSIPPDVFQGFSYVAPSVCDDAIREPWIDSQASSRRRQCGGRGVLSAGRLRRLGVNSSQWSGKPPGPVHYTHAPQPCQLASNAPKVQSNTNIVNNGYEIRPKSTQPIYGPPFEASHLVPSNKVLPCSRQETNNLVSTNNRTLALGGTLNVLARDADSSSSVDPVTTDFTLDGDEEIGEAEDEEDEELEEENVPGAQHIHGPTPYFTRFSEKPVSSLISLQGTVSVTSSLGSERALTLTHTRSAQQLRTAHTINQTSKAYQRHGAIAYPTFSPVPTSVLQSGHRSGAPGQRQTFPATMTTTTSNPGVSTQPSGASNSKCSIM